MPNERNPYKQHEKKLEYEKANKDVCSWCDQPIVKGKHNAVQVFKAPEKIMNWNGQELGQEGEKTLKAAYHAECYQKYRPDLPGRLECEKCGILSMAKYLPDGRSVKSVCACSCHNGANYCSLLIK